MSTGLQLYSVRVPRSTEDSEYYVVASNPAAAVDTYLREVLDEGISMDEEEMAEEGWLYVDLVG
ncbi:hypothetical protein [uncultured Jannaschia sp.]|uniref:hypothetical protein n=1 Tax=uncultured Jannaschia sp. TaxID=293347 RepID=UPI00260F25A9|nr:hypothetical protein [uncultured Jannaschia sp.]